MSPIDVRDASYHARTPYPVGIDLRAGSVIGLAPSAAAAEVLGDELRIVTKNTAKWLIESAISPNDCQLSPIISAEVDRLTTPPAR